MLNKQLRNNEDLYMRVFTYRFAFVLKLDIGFENPFRCNVLQYYDT